MGCTKFNTKESGWVVMGNDNNDNAVETAAVTEQSNETAQVIHSGTVSEVTQTSGETESSQPSVIQIHTTGVVTIILGILAIAVPMWTSLNDKLEKMSNDIVALQTEMIGVHSEIDDIHDEIDSIHDEIDDIHDEIDDIREYLYEDGGVKDQLGEINEYLGGRLLPISASSEVKATLVKMKVEQDDSALANTSIDSADRIGVDSNGKVYLAEELIGETILLTYKEDGKEVYFLGQYNAKFHWDGYCITNVYFSDGSLYSICESNLMMAIA